MSTTLTTGDSNNLQTTGVFSEDFSILCEKEGLIKIPLVVHNPKLQCGTSFDDHSSLGSRLHVTLEDDDPNSLKHVHFRNMRMNGKLVHVLVESSTDAASVQSLSLWNTGTPLSDPEFTPRLIDWMAQHDIQHFSIGSSVIPIKVFDDLIGLKSALMLVHSVII